MMTIKVRTHNAAFGETKDDQAEECARILEDCALKIRQGNRHGIAVDSNGNVTGEYRINNR